MLGHIEICDGSLRCSVLTVADLAMLTPFYDAFSANMPTVDECKKGDYPLVFRDSKDVMPNVWVHVTDKHLYKVLIGHVEAGHLVRGIKGHSFAITSKGINCYLCSRKRIFNVPIVYIPSH